MSEARRFERVQELAILEVLHQEHPDADTINLEHIDGPLWSYEIVEDGLEPVRSFLNWF